METGENEALDEPVRDGLDGKEPEAATGVVGEVTASVEFVSSNRRRRRDSLVLMAAKVRIKGPVNMWYTVLLHACMAVCK